MNKSFESFPRPDFRLENSGDGAFSVSDAELRQGFGEALRRASEGQEVVLRLWQWVGRQGLDAVLDDDKFRIHDGLAWLDGRTGRGFVTRGSLRVHDTIHDVPELVAVDIGHGEAGEEAPLWVGGMRFDGERGHPQPDGTDPWMGWPSRCFVVPEHAVVGKSDQWWLVTYVPVRSPASEEDSLAELMAQTHGALLQGARWLEERYDDVGWSSVSAAGRAMESHDEWCQRVDDARAAIARGKLSKVVLARAMQWVSPQGAFSPVGTLKKLHRLHPASFCFAWRQGGATFIGASPELLARTSGQTLLSEAVAGTVQRDEDPERDRELVQALRESGKDLHEHALVVDGIVARLNAIALDIESEERPRVLDLANVHHLVTPIRARVGESVGLLDVVRELHPTAAVGGTPRAEAISYLRTHEALDRGWYAAPMGWLGANGDGAFAVALRSAVLRGEFAWAFAGAGIVEASDPQGEWLETEAKLRTIGDALVTAAPAASRSRGEWGAQG